MKRMIGQRHQPGGTRAYPGVNAPGQPHSECAERSEQMIPTRLLRTSGVVVAGAMMVGCAPAAAVTDIVTIHYRQLGACNGFGNGTNVTSAGPKAAYVAFRISTVGNTDSCAAGFQL